MKRKKNGVCKKIIIIGIQHSTINFLISFLLSTNKMKMESKL